MKKILLFLALSVLSYAGYTQTFYAGAPGFLGAPELVDNSGNPTVNPNNLNVGQPIKLRLGFQNASFAYKIPNNTIQIQIDLGNRMVVNPDAGYVIANAPLNNYFTWTVVNNAGNQVIVGTQKTGVAADIAPGFAGVFEFEVRPSAIGSSSIVGNILIPNTNPTEKTTDPVDNDNSTNAAYTVTTALPVKFVNVDALRNNCSIEVMWNVADQINVATYQVEVSKDGNTFGKTVEVAASNITSYRASFAITDQIKANVLYVRIKQVDVDGKFTYSEIRTVKGTCDDGIRWSIVAYPNPVTSSFVTIKAKDGIFKGKYKLELIDNNGKLYQVREVVLDNVETVNFDFNTSLAPGNYNIRVSNMDGSQRSTVQFVKLGVL